MDSACPANIDMRTAAYGLLLLRVGLGAMCLAHALLKLLVFTLPGAARFFESAGLPPLAGKGAGAWRLPAMRTAPSGALKTRASRKPLAG